MGAQRGKRPFEAMECHAAQHCVGRQAGPAAAGADPAPGAGGAAGASAAEELPAAGPPAGGAAAGAAEGAAAEGAAAEGAAAGAAAGRADRWPVPAALAAEVPQWRREACPGCGKRAMFYCPFCCAALGAPEGAAVPEVRLPFRRCDVVFDDSPKKATSLHAKVLAPSQVQLIDLFTSDACANRTLSRNGAAGEAQRPGAGEPGDTATVREIPEYDPRSAVVLFPDEGSLPLAEAPAAWDLVPVRELVLIVIDAPWKRAQVLRRHPRLAPLRSARLRAPPASRFWRYHAEGPGCVSTIEALAAVAREVEEGPQAPAGGAPAGPDHALLYFFARQLVHIETQAGAGAELPTDEAAKERRSARVRQKDRAKRLRPLGGGEAAAGGPAAGGGAAAAGGAAAGGAAAGGAADSGAVAGGGAAAGAAAGGGAATAGATTLPAGR